MHSARYAAPSASRSRRRSARRPCARTTCAMKAAGPRRSPSTGTEHDVSAQADLVLAQRVVDGVQRQGVVPTVDLDNEPDVLPGDVEVDPPAGSSPHHLAARAGVEHAPSPAATNLMPGREDTIGPGQALLQGQAQDQGGRPVAPGLVGRPESRELRLDPGDASAGQGTDGAPAGGPHPGTGPSPAAHRQADLDDRARESGQPRGVQGAQAVEHGTGPGLPHRPPTSTISGDRAGADDDGVDAGELPTDPPSPRSGRRAGDASGPEVTAMSDATVVGRHSRCRRRRPLLTGELLDPVRLSG